MTALLTALLTLPSAGLARGVEVRMPAETRVYVETQEEVIGKKKLTQEGQTVRAAVWRDVTVDGQVVIKAGTPVVVRVDELKKKKIAGRRGKLTLGAYETTTVAGESIQLTGGYDKKGKGRIALSAALAGLVFLPLIFIKGKAAKLPAGTVFDAYTALDTVAELEVKTETAGPSIDLGSVMSELRVEVLYEELERQEKPEVFDFRIFAPPAAPQEFVIDRINGQPTEPLPLTIVSRVEGDDEVELRATVGIKALAKRFVRGINRFDVACTIDGERVAAEVILDIQF